MKLDNTTPYPAHLFRGVIDKERLFASMAVRVTYDLVGERLQPAEEQAWPVSPGPWEGPYGPMPGDELFFRGGVDVLIFGAARAPGGRPAPRVDVEARVGPTWRSRIVVYGDRVWRRGPVGLVPGAPEPFREVPLTLAYAYGGSDLWDGLEVGFPDNPEGRGFYLEEDSALGGRLPNLEDPAALIRAWDDRPEPVGARPCAINFGPRVRRGVVFDEQRPILREIRSVFYNDAFPQMIAPAARPGDRVSIAGVREDGPLVFSLPDNPLRVRVQIGDDGGERTPAIDQIAVEPDRRRVFLSYRYPFRYILVPHQRRSCQLVLADRA